GEVGTQRARGNRRDAAGCRERIVKRDDRSRCREEGPQCEEWRIEVLRRSKHEHPSIVVETVTATDHRARAKAPREARARRPVVAIGLKAGSRDTVGTDAGDAASGGLEDGHAVVWIDGRCVVFVANSERDIEGWTEFPLILCVTSVCRG